MPSRADAPGQKEMHDLHPTNTALTAKPNFTTGFWGGVRWDGGGGGFRSDSFFGFKNRGGGQITFSGGGALMKGLTANPLLRPLHSTTSPPYMTHDTDTHKIRGGGNEASHSHRDQGVRLSGATGGAGL